MSSEILACLKLIDVLAYDYLMLIANHLLVTRLWIIRPQKGTYGEIPQSKYCLAPSSYIIGRIFQIFRHCTRLGRQKEVHAFISFNPIPYGLIVMLAARIYRKDLHLVLLAQTGIVMSRDPLDSYYYLFLG